MPPLNTMVLPVRPPPSPRYWLIGLFLFSAVGTCALYSIPPRTGVGYVFADGSALILRNGVIAYGDGWGWIRWCLHLGSGAVPQGLLIRPLRNPAPALGGEPVWMVAGLFFLAACVECGRAGAPRLNVRAGYLMWGGVTASLVARPVSSVWFRNLQFVCFAILVSLYVAVLLEQWPRCRYVYKDVRGGLFLLLTATSISLGLTGYLYHGREPSCLTLCAVLLISGHMIALPMPRRAPYVECVVCSYNLTGNVSGVCPECGAAIHHVAGADS